MNVVYLNEYIIIEEPQDITDSTGCHSIAWKMIRNCGADIRPLFNSSILVSQHIADKIVSTNNYYEIIIRCSKNIHTRMRIVWKGRFFSIIRCLEYNVRSHFIKLIVVKNYNYN